MSRDRHDCRCRVCPCPSNADASAEACPSCTAGIHRPSEALQAHHRRCLDHWIEVMPKSLGSSGPSDRQMRLAVENQLRWHAEQDCPPGCWVRANLRELLAGEVAA